MSKAEAEQKMTSLLQSLTKSVMAFAGHWFQLVRRKSVSHIGIMAVLKHFLDCIAHLLSLLKAHCAGGVWQSNECDDESYAAKLAQQHYQEAGAWTARLFIGWGGRPRRRSGLKLLKLHHCAICHMLCAFLQVTGYGVPDPEDLSLLLPFLINAHTLYSLLMPLYHPAWPPAPNISKRCSFPPPSRSCQGCQIPENAFLVPLFLWTACTVCFLKLTFSLHTHTNLFSRNSENLYDASQRLLSQLKNSSGWGSVGTSCRLSSAKHYFRNTLTRRSS